MVAGANKPGIPGEKAIEVSLEMMLGGATKRAVPGTIAVPHEIVASATAPKNRRLAAGVRSLIAGIGVSSFVWDHASWLPWIDIMY